MNLSLTEMKTLQGLRTPRYLLLFWKEGEGYHAYASLAHFTIAFELYLEKIDSQHCDRVF